MGKKVKKPLTTLTGIVSRCGVGKSFGTPVISFTIEGEAQVFKINSGSTSDGVSLMKIGDELRFTHTENWVEVTDIENHTFNKEFTNKE